jgi:hypothetical protein
MLLRAISYRFLSFLGSSPLSLSNQQQISSTVETDQPLLSISYASSMLLQEKAGLLVNNKISISSGLNDSWTIDLVIQLLKTLISVSNDCATSIARIILNEEEDENECFCSLDWILSFLYVLFQMKEQLFPSCLSVIEDESNIKDEFSASLLAKKRVISDVIILLLSLLINISELAIPSTFSSSIESSSSLHFIDSVVEYDVEKSLRNYPLLQKICSQLMITKKKVKENAVENDKLPEDSEKEEMEEKSVQDTSLVNFLLDRILKESACFIRDLVSSDHCFASGDERNGVMSFENGSKEILMKEVNEKSDGGTHEDIIPIEELYISSYLVLFLNTLIFGKLISSTSSSSLDSRGNVARHICPTVSVLSFHVMSQLPNKSYWLFIRILKAFLALQGEVRSIRLMSVILDFFLHFLFSVVC